MREVKRRYVKPKAPPSLEALSLPTCFNRLPQISNPLHFHQFRALWSHYSKSAQAIIFVVDSSDIDRVEEAREVRTPISPLQPTIFFFFPLFLTLYLPS